MGSSTSRKLLILPLPLQESVAKELEDVSQWWLGSKERLVFKTINETGSEKLRIVRLLEPGNFSGGCCWTTERVLDASLLILKSLKEDSYSVQVSADGKMLGVWGTQLEREGRLGLLAIDTASEEVVFRSMPRTTSYVFNDRPFNPNMERIAYLNEYHRGVRVFNLHGSQDIHFVCDRKKEPADDSPLVTAWMPGNVMLMVVNGEEVVACEAQFNQSSSLIATPSRVNSLDSLPNRDGLRLLAGGSDGTVSVLQLTDAVIAYWKHKEAICQVFACPTNNDLVLCVSESGVLCVDSIERCGNLHTFQLPDSQAVVGCAGRYLVCREKEGKQEMSLFALCGIVDHPSLNCSDFFEICADWPHVVVEILLSFLCN